MRDFGKKPSILICEDDPIFINKIKRKYDFFQIEILSETEKKFLLKNQLPNYKQRFDYVFLGNILEQSGDPISLLKKCRDLLSGDGWLLAIVFNSQYKAIYDNLGIKMCSGFSLEELVAFFREAKYEDLRFDQVGELPGPKNCEKKQGAVEESDSYTAIKYWLIKAGKYDFTEKTSWLRSFLDPEIRQELAYVLRRIENDIELAVNCQQLWHLCQQYDITAEYLVPFIQNTMLHPNKVLNLLSENIKEEESNEG